MLKSGLEYKILPTITTTKGSDWKAKIKEINELGLKEIALFPTCLNGDERKELYRLIGKSIIKSIPLLHLRSDMILEELDYFVENYGTIAFNTHTQAEYPLIYDYSKYKNIIYIENVYLPFDEEELENFGGICLDFSHLEHDRLLDKETFDQKQKIIEKYPIGSNHISAIEKFTHLDENGKIRYSRHYLDDMTKLDYIKKYPSNYFSSLIAIELENSIREQLKAKDYIANLLENK